MAFLIEIFRETNRGRLVVQSVVALAALCLNAWGADPGTRTEYELKALFFVTLARYTQWPAETFSEPTEPLVIGVIGENPFGSKLLSLAKNEKIQEHPLQVKRIGSEEARACDMLFFGEMSPSLRDIALSRLAGRPILTVSDQKGFIEAGGMVELFLNNENRVRLKVSRKAIAAAGLDLTPNLWRLADVVASYRLGPVIVVETNSWENVTVVLSPPLACNEQRRWINVWP